MNEFSQAHKWVFVSFSGGKDSTAAYLKTVEQYPKHIITCVFTDTAYEHPETYDYLRWFNDNVHPVMRLASRIKSEKNGRRYFENVSGWTLQHNRSVGESCASGFCEV